jgi:hypothetical protein
MKPPQPTASNSSTAASSSSAARNRTAKGIVLVPTLLLGSAFLSAAAWMDGEAAANRPLALGLGLTLVAAGLLAQLLPEGAPEAEGRD